MDYLTLCLICKDENDYLPEWLDYHILMGVDRFYVYDNGSHISLRETLADYIARGWVAVMDIPGKGVQLYAYDHCLQTFGAHTRWMGFIDTDEFLVPKHTLDLKELLRNYEDYGGLAVSSLFFGSSGWKMRPAAGQLAAYTLRTHPTFEENLLVKSLVRPDQVLLPVSPHDFIFKEDALCVNEALLRVDGQRFPNYTEKIQLNHYFCRSESEIERKMARGRGASTLPWVRGRFEAVNCQATYEDTTVLHTLEMLFANAGAESAGLADSSMPAGLLEKMASLARARQPAPWDVVPPRQAAFRDEVTARFAARAQLNAATERGDYEERKRLLLEHLTAMPHRVILYLDLATCCLELNDPPAAWQAVARAWQLAPNSYMVLSTMAFYFLRVANFPMAKKTCHLLLEIAPHDLTALGYMTEALIGQGHYEEALKVGVPVLEVASVLGELPRGMGAYLVRRMADYLLQERQDYAAAARLWELAARCERNDVNVMLDLINVLLRQGDTAGARQWLTRAQQLAPQDRRLPSLLARAGVPAATP
jgi:tetratricopeptide (TPR) repeat protein